MFKLFLINCQTSQLDQLLHHVLTPNSKCLGKTEEFDVIYAINEHGLRDVSFEYQKPENAFRILFLGDSFTYGTGVNLQDTFVKQFERMISKQSEGYKIQTINAGVPAYGLILEDLYLKSKGVELEPDLVVVNLSMTDFFDERRLSKIAKKNQSGQIIAVAGPKIKQYLPDTLHNFFKKQSFIYNFFLKKQEDLWKLKERTVARLKGREVPQHASQEPVFSQEDPDKDTFAITRDIDNQLFDELFEPVAQRLVSIKKFLDERDITMILVVIPNGHQVDKNQWVEGRKTMKLEEESYSDKVFEELEKFANDNEIQIINTTDNLREHARDFPGEKLFFDYDGHLMPLGNKIVAEMIFEMTDLPN